MTIRRRFGALIAGGLLLSILTFVGFMLLHIHHIHQSRSNPGQIQAIESELTSSLLAIFIPLGSILVFWTYYWLRQTDKRFRRLVKAAEKFNLRQRPEPLPVNQPSDEIDLLADVFNRLRTRVYASWDQIQIFTLQASHELKTPLAVIRADVESALRQSSNPDAQLSTEWMHSALEELDRLTSIVDQLTYLSKADTGKLTIITSPLQLVSLLEALADDAETLASGNGLHMKPSFFAEVKIMGDSHRLRQMLLNLLANAIKHNIPGGWIQVSLTQANSQAVIAVSNTSEPLSDVEQQHVFDRFFRSDSTQRRHIDGAGLGLALVKWIVEEHEGTVELANQMEDGECVTRVVVKIPSI